MPEAVAYHKWYGGKRKQDWATPPLLFERLNMRFNFTMDGASDDENALLPYHSTEQRPVPWNGERVFCNPPWSNIGPFVELAANAELAVLLVPARTNAKWFHRALELGAHVEFFLGRPKFGKPGEAISSSPVDCVLLVFGNEHA